VEASRTLYEVGQLVRLTQGIYKGDLAQVSCRCCLCIHLWHRACALSRGLPPVASRACVMV